MHGHPFIRRWESLERSEQKIHHQEITFSDNRPICTNILFVLPYFLYFYGRLVDRSIEGGKSSLEQSEQKSHHQGDTFSGNRPNSKNILINLEEEFSPLTVTSNPRK